MYVVIDDRELVTSGYSARFKNDGVSAVGFSGREFLEWLAGAPRTDLVSVEGCLLGDCPERLQIAAAITRRLSIPVIAMIEAGGLEATLELFSAGVDDVVRKPVHVREILARVAAMHRRALAKESTDCVAGDVQVFFDGRDPLVGGKPFPLPRRERRILEYLVSSRGRRVTRTQIFNAIYGVFDDEIDETVIESHVSKLRKKLRTALGWDPVDSKRYLGYSWEGDGSKASNASSMPVSPRGRLSDQF